MKNQKTGGRVKGTPNKITKEMRIALTRILDNELDKIPELLSKIKDPEKKLILLTKFLPFVMPKITESTLIEHPDNHKTFKGFEYLKFNKTLQEDL